MKNKPEIVFEDEEIIIVNKPPFFLTIPDRFARERPNVQAFLSASRGEVFVVHRLDKETSGILCFAKNAEAHKNLSKQFQERTVEKIYLTLVDGQMHQTEGTIDKPIGPHPAGDGRMMIAKSGKPSITHFKVKEQFQNFALVEAEIKTGRTHQIRVHMKAIGYPLAIDAIYGSRESFLLSEIKGRRYNLGKLQEERPLMTRSALHAFRLVLDHPVTGTRLSWEADLPKDFGAVVKQLQKWNTLNA